MSRICTKTVMDDTDPNIRFNALGESNHYTNYVDYVLPDWNSKRKLGGDYLKKIVKKHLKKNSKYDCVIGLSGGLDSSYLLHYVVRELGMNPLVIHVDAGWNTMQASQNIRQLVEVLGVDYYAEVINWESVRKLQSAFLLSGIADQDIVQDSIFFGNLYRKCLEFKCNIVLTGTNYSTEGVREPFEWGGYYAGDKLLISSIMRSFIDSRIPRDLGILDVLYYRIWLPLFFGLKRFDALNYVNYEKKQAEETLMKEYGWIPFKHKHHESRFTRWYEDVYLARGFGMDKRKAHFSSLICSGQMTREEAIKRLNSPELDQKTQEEETRFVADKLGFTKEELERLITAEKNKFSDFKNKKWIIDLGTKMLRLLGSEKRNFS